MWWMILSVALGGQKKWPCKSIEPDDERWAYVRAGYSVNKKFIDLQEATVWPEDDPDFAPSRNPEDDCFSFERSGFKVQASAARHDDIRADLKSSHGYGSPLLLVFERTLSIADVAEGNANFSTMVAAFEATGLTDTLEGEQPYTLFVPDNAAFASLEEGQLERLLDPENKAELVALLSNHIVRGEIFSPDFGKRRRLRTLSGKVIIVGRADDGSTTVNGVTVSETDLGASNGAIHVIDGVLASHD